MLAQVLGALSLLLVGVSVAGLLWMVKVRGGIGQLGSAGIFLAVFGGTGCVVALLALRNPFPYPFPDGSRSLLVPGSLVLLLGIWLLTLAGLRVCGVPVWLILVLDLTLLLLVASRPDTTKVLLAVPFGLAWAVMGVVLVGQSPRESGRDPVPAV